MRLEPFSAIFWGLRLTLRGAERGEQGVKSLNCGRVEVHLEHFSHAAAVLRAARRQQRYQPHLRAHAATCQPHVGLCA